MTEKWLDAAYPGTAQQFIGALQAAGASGFAWYLGGDDALHAWDVSIVHEVEAAGFHGLAVYVPFLDHPGTIDGADAVRLARAANLPSGYPICLDMEPGLFRAHTISFDQSYADGFNGQLHNAGFRAVTYGTPDTVAAISNHADAIWVAVPGEPDPTTAGLNPAFFAGKRSVQWTSGVYNGVHCDLSTSEFSLAPANFGGSAVEVSPPPSTGVSDLTADEHYALIDVQNHLINTVIPQLTALKAELDALKAQVAAMPAASAAPEPKTLTIAGPITGTLA